MNLAEELKHLLEIRDLFSSQLYNRKIDEQTRIQIQELVESCQKRIYLILETLDSGDADSRKLDELVLLGSRSDWFNSLCKSILRILIAREIADRIDVSKIFSEIFLLF